MYGIIVDTENSFHHVTTSEPDNMVQSLYINVRDFAPRCWWLRWSGSWLSI